MDWKLLAYVGQRVLQSIAGAAFVLIGAWMLLR